MAEKTEIALARSMKARYRASLLSAVLSLLAGAAQADTYSCTTADGHRVFGERHPPECADRLTRRERPNGSVELIEPKLTPEQRKKLADEEKRQRDEAERKRDQFRRDLQLLEGYQSEDGIESARNRDLGHLQQRIESARKSVEQLEAKRKKLDEEAEFFRNRKLPENLVREREHNDAMLQSLQKSIDDTKAEMQRVNERYDQLLKRYRELTKPPGRLEQPAPK
jgi:hypothetical protein